MSRLLREPLLHFLLAGTLLFVLFAWTNTSALRPPDEIVVPASRVDLLLDNWARTWRRPATPAEIETVVDEFIREEIYYREALKLGLDKDDMIVRRRLRQKMEFLAEDFYEANDPGDDELQRFLDAHPNPFRQPAQLSFQQVYFSPDRRGDAALADATSALTELRANSAVTMAADLGDPFFLPNEFVSSTETDIARALGNDFVPKLLALVPGEWSGPLRSGFGYHVVKITNRVEGRVPPLDEIRAEVLPAWQSAERDRITSAFYERLRSQYSITVEVPESVQYQESR